MTFPRIVLSMGLSLYSPVKFRGEDTDGETRKSAVEEAERDGTERRTPTTSDSPEEEMTSSELREDPEDHEESPIRTAISSTT